MATFEDILSGKIKPSEKELLSLARKWLKKEYDLGAAVDAAVLKALFEVHTHSGPDDHHFGHPEVDSSLGRAMVQVIWKTGHWHLTFSIFPEAVKYVVHPKSEAGSWPTPENQDHANIVRTILTSAAIAPEPIGGAPVGSAPKALITDNGMRLFMPSDIVEEQHHLSDIGVDTLLDFDGSGRISVPIDLSNLGSNK